MGKRMEIKFSPKYYKSGWNGGGKSGIKTYDVSKIGKIGKAIKKETGPIGKIFEITNFVVEILEDGCKIGDNTKTIASEEVGSLTGEIFGALIGTMFFGPFGAFVGGIIGSYYGENKVKEYCQSSVDEKKQQKKEKEN